MVTKTNKNEQPILGDGNIIPEVENIDGGDKNYILPDVMRSLFVKCLDECYTEANLDGYHGNDNKEYVINEILQKYFS